MEAFYCSGYTDIDSNCKSKFSTTIVNGLEMKYTAHDRFIFMDMEWTCLGCEMIEFYPSGGFTRRFIRTPLKQC